MRSLGLSAALLAAALPARAGRAPLELEALAAAPAALQGRLLDGSLETRERAEVLGSAGAGLAAGLGRWSEPSARTAPRLERLSPRTRREKLDRRFWGAVGVVLGGLGAFFIGLLLASPSVGALALVGALLGWVVGDNLSARLQGRKRERGGRRRRKSAPEPNWSLEGLAR